MVMRHARIWIIGVGALILLAGGIIIPPRPFFIPEGINIFSLGKIVEENRTLNEHIMNLEAEIHSLRTSYVIPSSEDFISAKVFSFYPLNTRSIMYVSAGEAGGVARGDGVILADSVFVGQVVDTASDSSAVATLFDADFSLPVRIGEVEVEGLLRGGANPRVSLIDKTKTIASGDMVVSAARDFPYGLIVGRVSMVREDASGAFLEAGLELPYVLSDVRDVLIIHTQ